MRQEQRKNKTLEAKYNSVKLENKILKCGDKKSERTDSVLALREGAGGRGAIVPRHRHEEIAIRFAVLLYAFAGISSHQVPKVMQLAGAAVERHHGRHPVACDGTGLGGEVRALDNKGLYEEKDGRGGLLDYL